MTDPSPPPNPPPPPNAILSKSPLGKTGLEVTCVGYGAIKIGRNEQVKYPTPFDLPDETEVERYLNTLLDLGVNYVDTAPAYGLSEQRIGKAIAHRRHEYVLSTKVGETFFGGKSSFDFTANGVENSVEDSLEKLGTDHVDIVFIHSDGNDLDIMRHTGVIPALQTLKARGLTRAIGLSGKTVEGAEEALAWADVLMVTYHMDDTSHADVIARAANQGVGVVVKKGLGSGWLDPGEAIRFVLANPHVHSLVIGGLDLNHMRANLTVALAARSGP